MQVTMTVNDEGTTRELVKLDDGVAMDFTTTGDVDALRERVQNMAQRGMMHGQHGNQRGMMHGQHGNQRGMMHGQQGNQRGMMHGQQGNQRGMMQGQQGNQRGQQGQMTDEQRQTRQQMMQTMSDTTVETQEIDDGIRVTLTPQDAAQTDALYETMQSRSQMAGEQGQCPTMQMMGGGPQEPAQD